MSASAIEAFEADRRRRLVVLGVLQPRRRAPRHAAGRGDERRPRPPAPSWSPALLMSLRGSVCLYQGEELGLDRGRARASRSCRIPTASASGRSSRAATAAARRWSGKPTRRMAGFSTGKPWLPVPGEHIAAARSTVQAGRRAARCSRTTGASSPSAAPHPALRQRRHRLPRRAAATCSPSRARAATSGSLCVFNLGGEAAELRAAAAQLDATRFAGARVCAASWRAASSPPWRLRRLVRAHRLNEREREETWPISR